MSPIEDVYFCASKLHCSPITVALIPTVALPAEIEPPLIFAPGIVTSEVVTKLH